MEQKLLNKNYLLTVAAAMLFYTGAFMLNSVAAKYTLSLSAGETAAGILAALSTLCAFISRPFWGYFTDSRGRKIIYIAGAALCLASCVFMAIWENLWIFALSRGLLGLGYSALTTAGGTMVCDTVPRDKLSKAIAYYGLSNIFSMAAGPALALWLYSFGFRVLALAVCAVMAAVLVLILGINYREKKFLNPGAKFSLFEKGALPAAFCAVFFAAATAGTNNFIPVMAPQRQFSAGVFFTVCSAGLLLSRFAVNPLQDRFGAGKIFYAGVLALGAGFALLAFCHGNLLMIIAALLYAAGCGFVHPILNTAAVKNRQSSSRGLATGTFMMSQDLGMSIGSALWGSVSGKAGFWAVYLGCGLAAAATALCFRLFLKKRL